MREERKFWVFAVTMPGSAGVGKYGRPELQTDVLFEYPSQPCEEAPVVRQEHHMGWGRRERSAKS